MSKDVPFQRVRAQLEIAGQPLRVEGLSGIEGISALPHFDVDVFGDGHAFAGQAGAPALLTLAGEHGGLWRFAGILLACGPNPGAHTDWSGEHPFRLTLGSALHRLDLEQDDRLFVGLSTVDLARQLAQSAGIAIDCARLRGRYPVRTGILQSRESHYALWARTLSRAGIWFHGEDRQGLETLVLQDDAGDAEPALDHVLAWQGVDAGWQRQQPGVYHFAEQHRIVPRKIHVHGRLTDGRPYKASADTDLGEGVHTGIGYGLHSPEALEQRARILSERARTQAYGVQLDTTALFAGPGRWIELERPPGASAQLPRPWLIESLEHTAQAADDGWLAYRNQATLRPRAQAYRPQEPTRTRPLPEHIAARIEGDGPSLDGEGCQRARALFQQVTRDTGTQPWLARLTPYAAPPVDNGLPAGWAMPLHEDQEVRLVCLGGDPDGYAVVASGAYNRAQADPVHAQNPSEHRYQTLAGNTLLMDDLRETEIIKLHTAGEQHLLALNAQCDAHTLSLICRQGPASAFAGQRLDISTGAGMQERVGATRLHQVEQSSRSRSQQGPIHHQAETRHTALAHEGMNVRAGQDLQLKARADTRLDSGRHQHIRVQQGHFTANISGALRIHSERNLIISPINGAPIILGTPQGGLIIDAAADQITLYGQDIALEADEVNISGQVHYDIGSPQAIDTPEIASVPVLKPTPRLVPLGEAAVIYPAWVQDRLPLGDTAQLAFTVRDAEAGQTVRIEILGADGQVIDQFEHQLTQGHGRETLTWHPDDQAQAEIRILQASEPEDETLEPSGLHFHVILNGNASERSGPLLLTADLEVEHTDTQDKPLPEGTPVTLADAQGKLHLSHADSAGRTRFNNILVGAVDWAFGSAQAAEIVQVDDQAPGRCVLSGCQIVRGAPAVHTRTRSLPPPVMVNLRDDAPRDTPRRLSQKEIEYFRAQGNNALLFIHGYAVPLGEPGRHFEGIRHATAKIVGPFNARWQRADWAARPATFHQDFKELARRHPKFAHQLTDEALNGMGAFNWRTHMEYQLNRAAGFDPANPDSYTRIVSIAWSGDVASQDFFRSELSAQRAGRRLVPLLRQLQQEGIRINVITHSLGARVLLTALNILGEQHTDVLDHAFLWQPAVADNALSNSTAGDTHPLGIGVFPYAHRAAKQFVVLHSRNDGILGGRFNLARLALRTSSPRIAHDLITGKIDALEEDVIEHLGGAYPKKWWRIPRGGLPGPLNDIYREYFPLVTYSGEYTQNKELRQYLHPSNWPAMQQAMIEEMERLRHHDTSDWDAIPDYNLLAPVAIRRVLREEHLHDYIHDLRTLVLNAYSPDGKPRPALGHVGFEEIREQDMFIRDHSAPGGKFAFVKQDDWLYTHSGMRIPDDGLFEEVYKKRIMQQFLLSNSSFGKY